MSKRNYHDVTTYAEDNLASADPFYRGPARIDEPPPDRDIRPLSLHKSLRDLGRIDEPADDVEGMMPADDLEAKRGKL